jgi:hypothetical protein
VLKVLVLENLVTVDQLPQKLILVGYDTASLCTRFASFSDKLLASTSRFQVLKPWIWNHYVVWKSQERIICYNVVMSQKNGVLSYSLLKRVDIAASRNTGYTVISVTVLWLRLLISVLTSFPTIHALFDKHSSFSLDTHWSRNNENCVFLFCFRMVTNNFGNTNYKPLVSILKSTATKKPRNCRVNLWVINSNNSFSNTGGNLNPAYFKF